MTDYVATDLPKKWAEIAGELDRTHERLRELVNQLEAIDATLRIVAPDKGRMVSEDGQGTYQLWEVARI